MKKYIRIMSSLVFTLAAGILSSVSLTNNFNNTVFASTELTSDDGLWEFSTDGNLSEYLGDEIEVTLPQELTCDEESYAISGFNSGFLSYNETIEVINMGSNITTIPTTIFIDDFNLREINVSADNQSYCSIDGILYTKNKVTGLPQVLVRIPCSTQVKNYTIPSTVNSANCRAADHNLTVEVFNIHENFNYKTNSFQYREFLGIKEFNVSQENPYCSSLDGVLFDDDKSLLLMYPCCKEDESYEIPESVTDLASQAFTNTTPYLHNIIFNNIYSSAGLFSGVELTAVQNVTTREEYYALSDEERGYIQNLVSNLEGQPITVNLVKEEVEYVIDTYIEDDMSNYEKIKALHDYLCNKVVYDHETTNDASNHCISSAFLRDRTVCEGYAMAMGLLLNRVGIYNYIIGSQNAKHAYNIVELNGAWVYLDACWNDGNVITYYYFLTTGEEISDTEYHTLKNMLFDGLYADYGDYHYSPERSDIPDVNPLIGDINQDGVLTSLDLRYMSSEITGYQKSLSVPGLVHYYNIWADIDRDGDIDLDDYALLEEKVAATE